MSTLTTRRQESAGPRSETPSLLTRFRLHRARVAERDARLSRVDAEIGSRVDVWDRRVSA